MGMYLPAFALMLIGLPAMASEQGNWEPTSTTALAITGPIAIRGNRLTFGNGVSISLRPAAPYRPYVYVIDPPQNPVLLNGNKLCGEEAPTYLVVAPDGDSLYVKAFDKPGMPTASVDPLPQNGSCATYNFGRAEDRLSSGSVIRQVQLSLNARGYDAGGADGVMGRRTWQALSAFQQDRGLAVTGMIDEATLAALSGFRQTDGPSFDCARAGTTVERAVCASPELAALDAELASTYENRIAGLSPAAADRERTRQRRWMAARERCGRITRCLQRTYSERISMLEGDGPPPAGSPARDGIAAAPDASATEETISILGAPFPVTPATLQSEIPAEWRNVRPYVPEWLLAEPDKPMNDAERHRLVSELAAARTTRMEAELGEVADRHLAAFRKRSPGRSRDDFVFELTDMCIANNSGGYIPRSTLALCQEQLALEFLGEIMKAASDEHLSAAPKQDGQ